MGEIMKDKLTEIVLNISFNTPAFLGNSVQEAQWRVPPFKALFRRWWRVVKAKDVNYDYEQLLSLENELFGKASEKTATRSRIIFKLDNWNMGSGYNKIQKKVFHPEASGGRHIDSDLYLGYGPVNGNKTALPVGSAAKLSMIFPEKHKKDMEATVDLIAIFGSIGSRSRNGWGSINIEGRNTDLIAQKQLIIKYGRSFNEAMQEIWPHCIGLDSSKNPLIWQTADIRNSWTEVIQDLAKLKIAFRTHFEIKGGKFHPTPLKRHILSYPITNHDLAGRDMRMARNPSQLIFKVIKTDKEYRGLVYHMPSKVSDDFIADNHMRSQYQDLEPNVWNELHLFLDKSNAVKRI